MSYHLVCVVGARPNFMKMAPILAAFDAVEPKIRATLVHTGQHYDATMNHQYFEALGIRRPDVNLEVGAGSHAVQTAEVMRRFEPVLDQYQPDAVLVVGDVNSTLACALVASKKSIPVVHVEAGLRSFDRAMPEEINRVLTDQISDLLFTTEFDARDNLFREGVAEARICFVGNVMIDTLRRNLVNAVPVASLLQQANKNVDLARGFAALTLHRPSNVDDQAVLTHLLTVMAELSVQLPVIFPVHPRTRSKIEAFGLQSLLDQSNIICLPPAGYFEMLGLMREAKLVLTDSGGIQEETTALGVPCITLRQNTERPITVTEGTNTIVGQDADKIRAVFNDVLSSGGKTGRVPQFWDGQAALRIAAELNQWLGMRA